MISSYVYWRTLKWWLYRRRLVAATPQLDVPLRLYPLNPPRGSMPYLTKRATLTQFEDMEPSASTVASRSGICRSPMPAVSQAARDGLQPGKPPGMRCVTSRLGKILRNALYSFLSIGLAHARAAAFFAGTGAICSASRAACAAQAQARAPRFGAIAVPHSCRTEIACNVY